LVNNIEAGEHYKLSNKDHRENHDLVPNPDVKTGFPLKYILKKGVMVLMYDKNPKEIWEFDDGNIPKVLYKLAKFDAQGRLTFRPHSEARPASDLKEVYSVNTNLQCEQVRLQVSKLNIQVEGYDFKITRTGKIEKL